jgi:hypothetical protein
LQLLRKEKNRSLKKECPVGCAAEKEKGRGEKIDTRVDMRGNMAEGYVNSFEQALRRTQDFGLQVPDVAFSTKRFLSEAAMEEVMRNIPRWFPSLRAEHLVGQCLTVHANLRSKVEEVLKIPVYLTIGDISFSGERVFGVDDAYLNHLWIKKVTLGDVVKLHAWLTLPSAEIIDVTLTATYLALSSQSFERQGNHVAVGAIANHADELKDGMAYHPCIVGADYLHGIGALAHINRQEAILGLFLKKFLH